MVRRSGLSIDTNVHSGSIHTTKTTTHTLSTHPAHPTTHSSTPLSASRSRPATPKLTTPSSSTPGLDDLDTEDDEDRDSERYGHCSDGELGDYHREKRAGTGLGGDYFDLHRHGNWDPKRSNSYNESGTGTSNSGRNRRGTQTRSSTRNNRNKSAGRADSLLLDEDTPERRRSQSGNSAAHSRSYSTSSNPRASLFSPGGQGNEPISRPNSASHLHQSITSSGAHSHRYPTKSPLLSPSPNFNSSGRTHPSHSTYTDLYSTASSSSSSFQSQHLRASHEHAARQHQSTNPYGHSSSTERLAQRLQSVLMLGCEKSEWIDQRTGRRKIPERLRAYVPILIWVVVSVAMAVVVGVWHEQVFSALDDLSIYLKEQGFLGRFILFLCIFITTFPPLPLYSTFIILSGYSFGLLEGFIVSYTAALSGAVVVFLLSKVYLQKNMQSLLDRSPGMRKVLRAIEKRPKLLFLIRVSPYPYNVMNVLLASSSTLSFSCYFWCTALALPKLIIHCSVGTTIRSFAESAQAKDGDGDPDEVEQSGQRLKGIAGAVGAALCAGVFLYILYIARKAVDELDDSERLPSIDSDVQRDEYMPVSEADQQEMSEVRTGGGSSSGIKRSFAYEDEVKGTSKTSQDNGAHHRHGFERQASTLALLASDPKQVNNPFISNTPLPPFSPAPIRYSSDEFLGGQGGSPLSKTAQDVVLRLETVAQERM